MRRSAGILTRLAHGTNSFIRQGFLRQNISCASQMPEIAEVERARTILEQILKDQTLLDVVAVRALIDSR